MSEAVVALPQDAAEGYFDESRQPLVSLAFIAPLLVCYEVGVLVLRVQNGADAWMRKWLDLLGFSQHFLLPLLTVGILLGWHHVSRRRWTVRGSVLAGMAAECCLLAMLLWLVFKTQSMVWNWAIAPVENHLGRRAALCVGFLGAGIYEELLFRVILLSGTIWALKGAIAQPTLRAALAIAATSTVFAAAHHVSMAGVVGEPFAWSSFGFRVLAGGFFSVVFLYRGFGVVAGAHAAYNILVAA